MESARGFCPQCGGKVQLEVCDPLLKCSFCKTNLYIRPKDGIFCYFLDQAEENINLNGESIYIPYWRVKGIRLRILNDGSIKKDRIDASLPAIKGFLDLQPLGLSTQLSKMQLNTQPLNFKKYLLSAKQALKIIDSRIENVLMEHPASSVIFGEKVTLILAPFKMVRKDTEILLRPMWTRYGSYTKLKNDHEIHAILRELKKIPKNNEKGNGIDFIPLICPECGSDIPALSKAYALFCKSCKRLWAVGNGKMLPQKARIIAHEVEKNMLFLPFYHFCLKITGLPFNNMFSFLKAIFAYKEFPDDLSKEPVQMVIPAFSLGPSLYLRLAQRMSSSDLSFLRKNREITSSMIRTHCINVSLEAAFQYLPFLLLSIFMRRKKLKNTLLRTGISITDINLFFIGFKETGRDLIEKKTGQAIQMASIRYGLNL